jgi:long-chain fatty acid transport protein
VIVKSTPINISATSGNPSFDGITYIGDVSSHIDIVSVGIKYRWDDPAPEPVKQGYFKAK